MDFLFRGRGVVLTMNSVKILHAVRSAITAIAELLVNSMLACYAERCTSYSKSVCLSVYPCVRHMLALCQNDSSYDHEVFTGAP